MRLLQKIRDPAWSKSFALRFRKSRFAFFSSLLSYVPRPVRLLDVGGTEGFWRTMGLANQNGIDITLTNVSSRSREDHPSMRFVQADACDLRMFADGKFDIVFSNSVIEHVGDMSRCQAMADEVRRVGRRYFVQTPNRNFVTDPHFPFPFFQFFPLELRAHLLQILPLDWVGRIRNLDKAREIARSVHLLSEKDVRGLFPGCRLYYEKVLGLTKSFIAYAGW